MNRWISVKDRLPEVEKDVLVCEYIGIENKVIEMHVAFYNGTKDMGKMYFKLAGKIVVLIIGCHYQNRQRINNA